MRKLLNFSTILFSYVLISLLVISCGGGGGGNSPQGNPRAKCLLPDREDKNDLLAVICSEGEEIGTIKRGIQYPDIYLVIQSMKSADGQARAWDIYQTKEMQISHDKDYTLTVADNNGVGTISDAPGHTAEAPLKILTLPNLLGSGGDKLIKVVLMELSLSSDKKTTAFINLTVQLGVKTQEDFISMADFDIGTDYYKVPFVLENDLDLIAPGGEDAKFDNSIIPVAERGLDFDGSGYTISLNSAIDSTATDKPAAIIGAIKQHVVFRNFTLNINKPISGNGYVGAVVGSSAFSHNLSFHYIKVNINSNLTVYKPSSLAKGYVGGLLGIGGCVLINTVLVKTAENAAIRAAVKDYGTDFESYAGGLAGGIDCTAVQLFANINNSVVDVTIGGYAASDTAPKNLVNIGGLVSNINTRGPNINNNLVKLAISRGNLPANFAFDKVAGFVGYTIGLNEVLNNLVYADFSNLGAVKNLAGLFYQWQNPRVGNSIANNMVFIADGFNTSNVTDSFGVAMGNYLSNSNITNSFFSSPVTDYGTNEKLASFVHNVDADMTFNNLILDNTTDTAMFKTGSQAATLRGKVATANVFDLADAKITPINTLFKDSTSWKADDQVYPQLTFSPTSETFSPTSEVFSGFIKNELEIYWNETNADIQTKLAARANK